MNYQLFASRRQKLRLSRFNELRRYFAGNKYLLYLLTYFTRGRVSWTDVTEHVNSRREGAVWLPF